MTREERSLLEGIDKMLRAEEVRAQIQPVVERVRAELQRKTTAVMTWEPISLTTYGSALPPEIRSSWVFILRAGANTGAERHPNSHQRMMSFEGSGDMQVEDRCRKSDVPPSRSYGAASSGQMSEVSEFRKAKQTLNAQRSTSNAEVKPQSAEPGGKWQSNVLVSDPHALLERRWISIPQNVWHQPVVSKEADWVVVSFHTVPAEELIEERPIDVGAEGTRQMRYVG
jgi:hypothetical protein